MHRPTCVGVVSIIAMIAACKKDPSDGGAGSAIASSSASMAASAAAGSSAGAGSSTAPSAAGSGSASTASGSGSGAAEDPRFAALSPEDRRTCKSYATCRVQELRDDDPNAEAQRPAIRDRCFAAWVNLEPAEQKKLASCADRGGECGSVLACFESSNGFGSSAGSSAAPSGSAAGAGSTPAAADNSYGRAAFLADPLCIEVADKVRECVAKPEFIAALDDGATAKQKKLNARLRRGVKDWQASDELCHNAWDLLNYEYVGFLANPVAFKAKNALASCGEFGAAVKTAGGMLGGKTVG